MFIYGIILLLTTAVLSLEFGFESIQLAESETVQYAAIRFGDRSNPSPQASCRYTPDDDEWPSDAEWAQLNQTLNGALLKPRPLAISCYAGPLYDAAKCAGLKSSWTSMAQHANHPISVMSQWASGLTCVPTGSPQTLCAQGGFPLYAVNATTVRHVQMAVNFARNKNIRIVIKNSGHNFNGNNIGGYALSIWVHNLKGTKYYDNYQTTNYVGRAIALAGGTRATEVSTASRTYNTTILNAGGGDVAVAGGYFQGAGHSTYASFYGLAADHVLQISAVAADGRFVVADAQTNSDLFWAFRGGGGGTFGVVTSIVVRTFPLTPVASTSITFSTVSRTGIPGVSNSSFWAGIQEYLNFSTPICDNKGFAYNFIRHETSSGARGITFTSSISLPNRTAAELRAFTRPFLQRMNQVGIPLSVPAIQMLDFPIVPSEHRTSVSVNDQKSSMIENTRGISSKKKRALGDTVGNTLIASRLFQRSNYADASAIAQLLAVIRSTVEKGGYEIHGQVMGPTLANSGNPDNAILPAFRTTIMHTQAYEPNAWWDGLTTAQTPDQQVERHDRLQSYMQTWRDISPTGGAYMNEGDMQDSEWKHTFYGDNYQKLVQVKRNWDPWNLFWVISGVLSDEWEVRDGSGGGREGLYTQDGKLCRVGAMNDGQDSK